MCRKIYRLLKPIRISVPFIGDAWYVGNIGLVDFKANIWKFRATPIRDARYIENDVSWFLKPLYSFGALFPRDALHIEINVSWIIEPIFGDSVHFILSRGVSQRISLKFPILWKFWCLFVLEPRYVGQDANLILKPVCENFFPFSFPWGVSGITFLGYENP